MTKTKWKLSIRRVDVERMLILCASALVVALALGQDQTITTQYEESLEQIPVLSDTTLLPSAQTQSTVV